ncbi:MAG: N-acetylmuramoyl-L-alanine amidase [Pseudonocardiales bacterium]|nr:N-acetylmuramoyl-L-alanine amidase [Pseudonocardiales bacterium]
MRRLVVVLAAAAGLLVSCTSANHPSAATQSSLSTSLTSSASSAPVSTSAPPTTPSRASSAPKTVRTTARPPTTPRTSARPAPTTQIPQPTVSFPAGTGPVIALNPGHNGGNGSHSAQINRQVPAGFGEYKACDTTGTNTNAGYPEHAFNWDATLRIRTILQAHGVRVILTRPDDNGVGPCVDERARIGNQKGVAAVISIHSDGAPSAGHGFHVCYASRPPAGAQVDSQSRRLSTAVHDALGRGSGLVPSTYIGTNGYYPRSDLAGLNLASVPATFLELGNMRNGADASLLSSASGRQRIAAAVAAGILAYLGR